MFFYNAKSVFFFLIIPFMLAIVFTWHFEIFTYIYIYVYVLYTVKEWDKYTIETRCAKCRWTDPCLLILMFNVRVCFLFFCLYRCRIPLTWIEVGLLSRWMEDGNPGLRTSIVPSAFSNPENRFLVWEVEACSLQSRLIVLKRGNRWGLSGCCFFWGKWNWVIVFDLPMIAPQCISA